MKTDAIIDRELAIELTKLNFIGVPIEIELPIETNEDLDWDIDDDDY